MKCRRQAESGTTKWSLWATSETMIRAPLWLAAFWWVSLSILGFVVVPLLFATLPQAALAGNMAARLFTAQTWVSCLCALPLLVFSRPDQTFSRIAIAQEVVVYVVAGLLLALLTEFAVGPRIVARENLRFWHSLDRRASCRERV